MHVIIYAKSDEEGHMTFPIHVLDDVTYCTRTKPGLKLYIPDLLPTLRSLQFMTNDVVSKHTDLPNPVGSHMKTSFMSLPLQTAEMEGTCSGLRRMPGLSSLWRAKNSARSKLNSIV